MGDEAFNSGGLTELPFGLPGHVYRSPMPFKRKEEPDALFESYLREGISVVVMLASERESLKLTGINLREHYTDQGFEVIYLPIPDFGVPEIRSLEAAVQAALELASSGRNIVAHCNAGIGRTGLFMACLARRALDLPGEQAVAWVRKFIPHALEVPEQVEMAHEF